MKFVTLCFNQYNLKGKNDVCEEWQEDEILEMNMINYNVSSASLKCARTCCRVMHI